MITFPYGYHAGNKRVSLPFRRFTVVVSARFQSRLQLRRVDQLRHAALDRIRKESVAVHLQQGHGENIDGHVCEEVPAGQVRLRLHCSWHFARLTNGTLRFSKWRGTLAELWGLIIIRGVIECDLFASHWEFWVGGNRVVLVTHLFVDGICSKLSFGTECCLSDNFYRPSRYRGEMLKKYIVCVRINFNPMNYLTDRFF